MFQSRISVFFYFMKKIKKEKKEKRKKERRKRKKKREKKEEDSLVKEHCLPRFFHTGGVRGAEPPAIFFTLFKTSFPQNFFKNSTRLEVPELLRPQENPYRNNIDSSKLIYIKLTRGSLFWSLDYTYKPIITGDMNELFNN